ncbi:MAG: excinuclease ABC subunit UvrA [Gemmatimonadota bacterium]
MRSRPPIAVRGARQHNLRGIDVEFPQARLSVITGVSGSGKSSLALDTLYAEGQRRFVASLSTYAQQFLDRLPRPDVDTIEGLPPAIAIEQSNPTLSRRSTVGTATEVFDYLRLLFGRAGTFHCPTCDVPVRPVSPSAVADLIGTQEVGSAWYVTFALPVSPALTHAVLAENLRALGFLRLLAGGRELHLDEFDQSESAAKKPRRADDLTRQGPLFVVVDRIVSGTTPRPRVAEAVERAYAEGDGEAALFARGATAPEQALRCSNRHRCDGCGQLFPELKPTLFSFNSPVGACPGCNGFGNLLEFDPIRLVPDASRSLADGAIDPWSKPRYARRREALRTFARAAGISWTDPWADLPEDARAVLLEGGRLERVKFEGVIPFLEGLTVKKYKAYIRFFLRGYQSYRECPDCGGSRLRPEIAWVRLGERTLPELSTWSLPRVADWLASLGPDAVPLEILTPIRAELGRRLELLLAVGLDYLTLDRLTRSLSGGEAQRIAIANALGTPLTETLYVLDEPSVGLHARDTDRLIGLLRELTERGNTVVVVEHDLDVVRAADHVVELGPGSGAAGGGLLFSGPPATLAETDTATGTWLRGAASLPERRPRPVTGPWLTARGARGHNLRDIDVGIPLRTLTAVTGVSGSGKSTLVHDVLYRALAAPAGEGGVAARMEGAERLAGVVLIDQTPIGRSPRSNPVTYVQAFDPIRALFAATPAARRLGFTAGHFSFNTESGRCSECRGDGHQRIEMHFLPDVFVACDACRGRRYRPEVLAVAWRGASIAGVLELTVDQAIQFLDGEPAAARGLRVLQAVGLGYLALGQPATTLSGGEAQRLKIARELARGGARGSGMARAAGRAGGASRGRLYLLDEPTTGLHHADVGALARVLDELIARGHTVVIIEHHLELISRADWVIDLGPEGGPAGGRVVAAGPPAAIAACAASHTGRALRAREERLAAGPAGKTKVRLRQAVPVEASFR